MTTSDDGKAQIRRLSEDGRLPPGEVGQPALDERGVEHGLEPRARTGRRCDLPDGPWASKRGEPGEGDDGRVDERGERVGVFEHLARLDICARCEHMCKRRERITTDSLILSRVTRIALSRSWSTARHLAMHVHVSRKSSSGSRLLPLSSSQCVYLETSSRFARTSESWGPLSRG